MRLKKIFRLFTDVLPKLNKKEVYFIFPFYHLGGAETVHRDIMEVFFDRKTACIITNQSENELNKPAFSKITKLVEIENIIVRKKEKDVALKLIARKINRNKNAVVFGCNSHFFYDLIPFLNADIKIIDLIHAFSYEELYAAEKYSLNYVSRIQNRIILGENTYADFAKLYESNAIDEQFLNRLKIIRNKVEIPSVYPEKPANQKLKILFVGRNGYEKRPELFFEIAQKTFELGLSCEFFVIGFSTDRTLPANTTIVGALTKTELDQYYLQSDLLLITSSREGFPMVVLEGMGFGVVPVCTAVGEIPSFINGQHSNGFTIPNTEPEAIAADFISQIKILESNRKLLEETSKNAYKSVKETFGSETFNEKYRETFGRKNLKKQL
ncbi:hypothetical protein FNO01nite_13390 [Flavobacterium noncentrifugens]|uniref:Glycosyltransferase involved in cell wall bisynthesis n=1 Tax=Flavobacterium noncentrifugens TaxID=1128970 RepID=A0A1G8VV51_9FLAO|nr:glycosyltransferase family 4 protein [Flavobacterium noncentrifugens]GEP50667.1 hypothetical protein FNO01nite_13390 [Flavobacterium noncentrifugens]SDJ70011.1 Glycosyltransferase involved in cell wall bisynthesis [Flavobacterium noncentrifugens]